MKVYKLVDAEQRSYILNHSYGMAVQYQEGKKVTAPEPCAKAGYHLLAFSNPEDALSFIEATLHPGELWTAEAEGIVENPPEKQYNPLVDGNKLSPCAAPTGAKWPKGTVMAKSLTLTERLMTI